MHNPEGRPDAETTAWNMLENADGLFVGVRCSAGVTHLSLDERLCCDQNEKCALRVS